VAGNHYDFFTRWRVTATCGEVYEVLMDGEGLARWWPSVYLDVKTLAPGVDAGLGKVISLSTKGWLPYTLHWRSEIVEVRPPNGFALKAHGDFEGTGTWSFEQEGEFVVASYDWQIDAEKPLLKLLTPLLKPVFSANHRWAMARGEESLKLELARRQARTDAERDAVPPPPAPTFRSDR
jgi:uncharacterized protein YndB with AHSA1/START domain